MNEQPSSRRRLRTGAAVIAASILSALGAALAVGTGASGRSTPTTRTVTQTTAASGGSGSGSVLDVSNVASAASGSVVTVHSTLPDGAATGSGFIIDTSGDIVTNDHVVENAQRVTISFGSSSSAKRIVARVVGTDPSSDLALLKVDPSSTPALHPLTLGSSAPVKVGQAVVAIGSPLGYDETVTSGIVSAKDRTITSPNGFSISGALQTDTAINPGNSGGPLLDSSGRVVGINSQIATGGSQSEQNIGIGFAIGIDALKADLPGLKSGHVRHAWLGVATGTASRAGHTGALVGTVTTGGPAKAAGLRAGDLIVALGGHGVSSAEALDPRVTEHQPGDRVVVVYYRGGTRQTAEVTLGNRPETTQSASDSQGQGQIQPGEGIPLP
jgi:putative serine protease PepD